MSLRVLLADDHRMLRGGLRAFLSQDDRFEVVGEASTGYEAVERTGALHPDVVVMDVGMPELNGIDATRQIRGLYPQTRVVMLSIHASRRDVLRALEAGAGGYVLKTSACDELKEAVLAVVRGKSFLTPEVAAVVVDSCLHPDPMTSDSGSLGAREREVLQRLAEGETSKEIAGHLSISERTVETHRRNIMKKLDLHSVADLTRYAIRKGLVRLEN